MERNHLNNIESGITGEIKEIHESTDYVNPYAVGDYDDGNLSFAKSLSANKYGKRLEELENYIPKPYSYRVDISADGATETYYIGASDVILKDGKKVISANSDLGYELINYQTIKIHKDGKEYDLYVQLMFAMKYFNKKIGNMQFICVDEGQDLAVNEYRLLSELNQNHVVFNIFGDTNQLMKSGRGISDWNLLLSELQAEQSVLNENYRNTNQITRFCNDNFGLKTLQTGVDGPKVREISRRDLEKELAGLMITTERIAILLPRTVQKMKYLDMDILPENIRNMIGETMDNGFISVMYVDEVKGIEFDKVFVVSAAMHRNEKYIAYTRALSELIVVVDEKLMNNNSAKKVKENIEHNKKAGIHSAKMTGTLKWEKTKQPKAYTLEKTIDNDVITYHFTENTKSIIKNEFANTDSILPSSIASSPLTNIKKNIYAHCVYIENSICYNINCKENMGKKCNKEGNCDYYISLPVPPDEEELIAEDIDNAKKYLAKYS